MRAIRRKLRLALLLSIIGAVGVLALFSLLVYPRDWSYVPGVSITIHEENDVVALRRFRVRWDMASIAAIAQEFTFENGRYPRSIEEIVLAGNEVGTPLLFTLTQSPVDPWGNEYKYRWSDGAVKITCFGSDRAPGGEGEAADIVESYGLAFRDRDHR